MNFIFKPNDFIGVDLSNVSHLDAFCVNNSPENPIHAIRFIFKVSNGGSTYIDWKFRQESECKELFNKIKEKLMVFDLDD